MNGTWARRWMYGLGSWCLLPFFLLGRWIDLGAARLNDTSRESRGLALVLTGIQGASFLEQQLALGLADAGFAGRTAIVDWTTGRPGRFPRHMRDTDKHNEAARELAARIRQFHADHPQAPVHLVGYSGGAAVALGALEECPAGEKALVDGVALVAAACSPRVNVTSLLDRTRRGIWHFRSRWDVIFLGLLTRTIGTTDGIHGRAAGCTGFLSERMAQSDEGVTETPPPDPPRFHEYAYRRRWLRQFHYGGHLGYANRVWASETLGRTLLGGRD